MVYKARPSRDAFINCKQEKGETLMKNALVRILTLATLATSLSAFAATDERKNDNAGASAAQQQEGCAASHKEKKQKKAKSQRDDQRTEQEKEFDRVLMGYYGG
jgi:hypothetical protein